MYVCKVPKKSTLHPRRVNICLYTLWVKSFNSTKLSLNYKNCAACSWWWFKRQTKLKIKLFYPSSNYNCIAMNLLNIFHLFKTSLCKFRLFQVRKKFHRVFDLFKIKVKSFTFNSAFYSYTTPPTITFITFSSLPSKTRSVLICININQPETPISSSDVIPVSSSLSLSRISFSVSWRRLPIFCFFDKKEKKENEFVLLRFEWGNKKEHIHNGETTKLSVLDFVIPL